MMQPDQHARSLFVVLLLLCCLRVGAAPSKQALPTITLGRPGTNLKAGLNFTLPLCKNTPSTDGVCVCVLVRACV